MKLGIALKIDVTKIDKTRLVKGKKGTYLDLTTFIDVDNIDQYDNNGFISHSRTKQEKENKANTPIVGNVKVFWNDANQQAPQQNPRIANHMPDKPFSRDEITEDFIDDDIPF